MRSLIVVADIPGLIPGAHKNRGLGIGFLRHIERCIAFLFIIDSSVYEPWLQLEALRDEIDKYKSEMLRRPSAVIANKIDLPEGRDNLNQLQDCAARLELPFFAISAKDSIGIVPVLKHIRQRYDLVKENIDEN
jgi:GTP-binding protein